MNISERTPPGLLGNKRLFVAALIVSLLASFGASVLTFGGLALVSLSSEDISFTIGGLLLFILLGTIRSWLVILPVLVLIAFPLTVLLDRSMAPVLARNSILLAIGVAAGLSQGQIGLVYGLTASVFWLVAIHYLARHHG